MDSIKSRISSILKEFYAGSDDGGDDGDGNGREDDVHVYGIEWDTEGEEVDLPTEVSIRISYDPSNPHSLQDEIAEALSNETGWAVISFDYKVL